MGHGRDQGKVVVELRHARRHLVTVRRTYEHLRLSEPEGKRPGKKLRFDAFRVKRRQKIRILAAASFVRGQQHPSDLHLLRDRIRSAHVILIEMCDDEGTDPGNIPRFQVLHDLRSVLFLAAVDDQRLSCVDQHDRVRLSHLEKCGCQRLRVRPAREKLPGAVRSRPRRAAGQSPCQEQHRRGDPAQPSPIIFSVPHPCASFYGSWLSSGVLSCLSLL